MIVYDVHTAAFIREAPVITLDSYNQAMKRNADGSGDVYFGPQAPAGKETSRIYTAAGKAFSPPCVFTIPTSRSSTGRGSCRTSSGFGTMMGRFGRY
jgi:hypothetical protein